jgi:O-Antigen ligase
MTGTSTAMTRGSLLIAFLLGSAVLGDRVAVSVSTGGRGVLEIVAIVAPLAAAATVARHGSLRSLGFLASPVFVFGVAPYLALTAVLPVLGVMFNGFPVRTLWSITGATTALSFLVIGSGLTSSDDRWWRRWLLLAIVLQLVYATAQTVYVTRGPGWELFTPFHQWDLSVQMLFGELVQARATGFYHNPNELGLWAGVAVVLSWTMLPPRLRGVGVSLALLTLLLSQSRGAAVALVAVLVAGAVLSVARGQAGPATWFRAVLSFGFAGLVAAAVVLALEPSGTLTGRFGALLNVLTQGPTADPNLAGRLQFWAAVVNLNAVYPWGTWGSPEMFLGTAVDSSWFVAFAQGSVPYVASLALLIFAPLAVRDPRFGRTLLLSSALVGVAALTQTSLGYPATFVFWALLGSGLQSSVAARGPAPVITAMPGSGTTPTAGASCVHGGSATGRR